MYTIMCDLIVASTHRNGVEVRLSRFLKEADRKNLEKEVRNNKTNDENYVTSEDG